MEQQPGAVNWAPHNPLPAEGAVRMWTLEALAAGAEAVSYFRWRQAPFAQEQMHEGLLLRDDAPNEALGVVAALAREPLIAAPPEPPPRAEVALLFDYESAFAWKIQPQGCDFSYFDLVLSLYAGLRRLGLTIDVAPATGEAAQGRKLIVAPALFAAGEDLVRVLSESDAAILIGPRAGSKTAEFQIPANLAPGALRQVVDLRVARVETLRPGAAAPASDGAGAVIGWRERVELGSGVTAEIAGEDGGPLVARAGKRRYLAGVPDRRLLDETLRRCAADAGLATLDLGEDLRLRDCGSLRFLFNYGRESADIARFNVGGAYVLGGPSLAPCGVAAFLKNGPER